MRRPPKRPRPGLILLDLNMPRKDGRTVLKEIKSDPELRQIPVVVLTTSKADEDIYKSYDLGVNSYIVKPVTFEALVDILADAREVLVRDRGAAAAEVNVTRSMRARPPNSPRSARITPSAACAGANSIPTRSSNSTRWLAEAVERAVARAQCHDRGQRRCRRASRGRARCC